MLACELLGAIRMKMFYEKAKNGLRNLFNVREKRKPAPVGTKPAINTDVCRGTLKMQVTHEIDNVLWQWLALQGWRKITVPNDRRCYRRLPKGAMKILMKTPPEALDSVHGRMLAAVAGSKTGRAKTSRSAKSSPAAQPPENRGGVDDARIHSIAG